ncbi:DUF4157 domain-containing protein [Oscillochloris sp. ZM17-4]|uniref:eCIS core domain-containing protein n=1 Tax=Oscillochloris sp. ZM17-4 TaxID=2866714 RepID=UPI001C731D8E|nr:DUF4157 domain-containing protein [Oscillochloris sp. ZM17-4]MBX0329006.1 DUF4157 domain-containing protein [Oscillochloris sp. ZM17-4]
MAKHTKAHPQRRPSATDSARASLPPARPFAPPSPAQETRPAAREPSELAGQSDGAAQAGHSFSQIAPSWGGRPASQGAGLPEQLRGGVEALSGVSMGDVSVRYNSSAPARLHALAYAQGTQIQVGPGQERHLAHEAWHVAQQKQGRVRSAARVGSLRVNADPALEREAQVMGQRAARGAPGPAAAGAPPARAAGPGRAAGDLPVQPMFGDWVSTLGYPLLGALAAGGAAYLGDFSALPTLAIGAVGAAATALATRGGGQAQTPPQATPQAQDPSGQTGQAQAQSPDARPDADDAKLYGPASEQLRQRQKRGNANVSAELGYLDQVKGNLADLQTKVSTLENATSLYEPISAFLLKRSILLTSQGNDTSADAIKAVIENGRGACNSYYSGLPKVRKAYDAQLQGLQDEEILTKRQLSRYGQGSDASKAKLAKGYQAILDKLDQQEDAIQQAYNFFSGSDFAECLADINTIARARLRVKAEQTPDRPSKAKGKGAQEPEEEPEEKAIALPQKLADDTSGLTIKIMNKDADSDDVLTGAEANKVKEFISLDGTKVNHRLRDTMNDHFGKFEHVNHSTIRISQRRRLEFDYEVKKGEIQIRIVKIGDPTYAH